MSVTPKKYMCRDYIRILVFIGIALFSSVLIWERTISEPSHLNWNSWAYYEWLINYEGGFVRRGFVGALIRAFFYEHELPAINILVGSSAIIFIGLVTTFASINIKTIRSTLLFSFCPAGLYWMAVGNEYFYRKEIIFYISIFCCGLGYQYCKETKNRFVPLALTLLILIASILLPLIHESFVFFCGLFFSLVLFSLHSQNTTAQRRIVVSYFTFLILTFVLLTAHKGDGDTSAMIWQSLSDSAKSMSESKGPSGGIVAIGWTLFEGLRLSAIAVLSGVASYYLFSIALVYLVLGFIIAEIRSINVKVLYLSRDFAFPFLLVTITFLPLFLAGWDWGRWVMGIWYVGLCIFILELDKPLRTISIYFRQPYIKRVVPSFFLLLLFTVVLTRIPECCFSGSGNSLLSNPTAVSIKTAIKNFID
jgi:hypothetical protein